MELVGHHGRARLTPAEGVDEGLADVVESPRDCRHHDQRQRRDAEPQVTTVSANWVSQAAETVARKTGRAKPAVAFGGLIGTVAT